MLIINCCQSAAAAARLGALCPELVSSRPEHFFAFLSFFSNFEFRDIYLCQNYI